MQMTRESEYALMGLSHLAKQPSGVIISLGDLAAVNDLPASFLAKIFDKLVRHGLVVSHRGPGGGVALERDPSSIPVLDILEAIEGPRVLNRCLIWQGHCADTDPCPLHEWVHALVPKVESILQELTLADFAERRPGVQV